VFAVDEKTAIQALDRLDPVLPMSPGRAERHGFEYYRHGTLSLLAALNTWTGEVLGHTVPRHTSAAIVDFLGDLVTGQPARRDRDGVLAAWLQTARCCGRASAKLAAVRAAAPPGLSSHRYPDDYTVLL
jgi:hypothetical protein